jgi:hypothetical protein
MGEQRIGHGIRIIRLDEIQVSCDHIELLFVMPVQPCEMDGCEQFVRIGRNHWSLLWFGANRKAEI